jgi:YycE-like N-terminal domain
MASEPDHRYRWPAQLPVRQVRVARPTDRLEAVECFYREGLGLVELERFEDHRGYSGVMFGLPGKDHHLEFTTHVGGSPGVAPSRDNLLVLYLGSGRRGEGCRRSSRRARSRSGRGGEPLLGEGGRDHGRRPRWLAGGAGPGSRLLNAPSRFPRICAHRKALSQGAAQRALRKRAFPVSHAPSSSSR